MHALVPVACCGSSRLADGAEAHQRRRRQVGSPCLQDARALRACLPHGARAFDLLQASHSARGVAERGAAVAVAARRSAGPHRARRDRRRPLSSARNSPDSGSHGTMMEAAGTARDGLPRLAGCRWSALESDTARRRDAAADCLPSALSRRRLGLAISKAPGSRRRCCRPQTSMHPACARTACSEFGIDAIRQSGKRGPAGVPSPRASPGVGRWTRTGNRARIPPRSQALFSMSDGRVEITYCWDPPESLLRTIRRKRCKTWCEFSVPPRHGGAAVPWPAQASRSSQGRPRGARRSETKPVLEGIGGAKTKEARSSPAPPAR